MNKRIPLLIAALCLSSGVAVPATAAEGDPDLDGWSCKFCPAPTGWTGFVELGLASVSGDSAAFGNARGLEESGIYGLAGAQALWLGSHGAYGRILAENLPLDARFLSLSGGRFGRYRAGLSYREIPRYFGTGQTPFSGGSALVLPVDWQPAGTTSAMAQLESSLRPRAIGFERRRLALDGRVSPGQRWQVDVALRRDERSGDIPRSASFLTQAAQLVVPVDLATDEVEVQARYLRPRWHADISYYGSRLRNDAPSTEWANPFTPISDGASQGRLAGAPDNEHHRLSIGGAYRVNAGLNVGGGLAVGRTEQDEPFVAATENPNLGTLLPRNSLDGRVETLRVKAAADYRALPTLKLRVDYLYKDRDNRTPVALWEPVLTDVSTLEPRQNQPYSFRQHRSRVTASWRPRGDLRVQGRLERDSRERTLQQAETTDDDSAEIQLRWRPIAATTLDLTLDSSRREASGTASAPDNGENARLRQFHLADRDRQHVRLRAEHRFSPVLQAGLAADWAEDDYRSSEVGLQNARELALSADVSWTPVKNVSAHAFAALTRIQARLAGSQQFAGADWFGRSDDKLLSGGIGVRYAEIVGALDAELDYSIADANGEVQISNGAAVPEFPDLASRLDLLRLNLDYPIRERLKLRLGYWLERYDTQDWSTDGIAPDTIPNVLSLGLQPPNETVHTIWLSVRYAL